jgi:phage terminase small subunit
MPLTNKQQAFIQHYLTCWNATEAARRAGYSEKTARAIGSENLTKPDIQTAINSRIREFQATADEVLLRLTSHSRGDMDDFVVGDYLNLDRARALGKMHLIKKLKIRTTTVSKPEGEDIETHDVEVDLYDAQSATVQLGRALGLFVERVKVEDWRTELEKHGIDAGRAFEQLVQAANANATATDGGASNRGSSEAARTNGHHPA